MAGNKTQKNYLKLKSRGAAAFKLVYENIPSPEGMINIFLSILWRGTQ